MEKSIIIAFIVAFLVREVLGIILRNMIKEYIRIASQYKEQQNQSLEWKKKARCLRKKMRIVCFLTGWNPLTVYRKLRKIYNQLNYMIAATEFLDGNNDEFIKLANTTRIFNQYELMPCLLALYYLSKKNKMMAERYYRWYLLCNHEKPYMECIMKEVFGDSEKDEKAWGEAIQEVSDQALIKALRDNQFL